MTQRASSLAGLSMITANYGNLELAEAIHKDWFRFLGGTPGEIVFVENGSPLPGQTALFQGVKNGWITKLLSVRPGAFDIGKHQAFIAEVSALAMSTRRNVLLYHLDVLVSRRGREDWLVDAERRLQSPSVYAIGGSFNAPSKSSDYDDEWYLSKKLSGNFALLPRTRYQEAWLRVAGSFLRSGFREEHPLPIPARRFIMEVGLEQLLESRDWRTLVRRESREWIILHTNLNGAELAAARERFFAGEGVERYLNAGDELLLPQKGGLKLKYFGQPGVSPVKQLRIAIGASPLGPLYRALLGKSLPPAPDEVEPPTLRELAMRSQHARDDLSVVVWVDEPGALKAGIAALVDALGGRPAQVIALIAAEDPAVDRVWQAHVDGSTDKLLVSRELSVGRGMSTATLIDHGVFAHAHCANYLLANASALESAAAWVPQALERLREPEGGPIYDPAGSSLDQARFALLKRGTLLADLEAQTGAPVIVGVGPGEHAPGHDPQLSARRGAA
jgi:hypothetical protein